MINKKITCIGKNIKIRSLQKTDNKIFAEWQDLDEVNRYFPNKNFLNEIKNKSWVDTKIRDKNGIYFVIFDAKNNTNIGMTILENIDKKRFMASWGIYISQKKFMKKDYVFEASNLILSYAFENLGMRKVSACSLANNIQGRNFHKKLGFVEEAIFNNQILIDDYYVDLIWISLTYANYFKSESYRLYP